MAAGTTAEEADRSALAAAAAAAAAEEAREAVAAHERAAKAAQAARQQAHLQRLRRIRSSHSSGYLAPKGNPNPNLNQVRGRVPLRGAAAQGGARPASAREPLPQQRPPPRPLHLARGAQALHLRPVPRRYAVGARSARSVSGRGHAPRILGGRGVEHCAVVAAESQSVGYWEVSGIAAFHIAERREREILFSFSLATLPVPRNYSPPARTTESPTTARHYRPGSQPVPPTVVVSAAHETITHGEPRRVSHVLLPSAAGSAPA